MILGCITVDLMQRRQGNSRLLFAKGERATTQTEEKKEQVFQDVVSLATVIVSIV